MEFIAGIIDCYLGDGPYRLTYPPFLQGNCPSVQRHRDTAFSILLDCQELTHVLFIDADMGFCKNHLIRLVQFASRGHEVVGIPGPTKTIYWEHVEQACLEGKDPRVHAFRYGVNLFPDSEEIKLTNGFTKVLNMGCCFMMVARSAVEKLAEAYPETKTKRLWRMNQKEMESDNVFALFNSFHCEDEDRWLEPDHAFQKRWRNIGGEIWADMTSDLKHSGNYTFQGNLAKMLGISLQSASDERSDAPPTDPSPACAAHSGTV